MDWDAELAGLGPALGLEPEAVLRLARFLALLEEANRRTNLVGDPPERWVARHVVDSLLESRVKLVSGPLADVGSGAGFPGLVLAAVDPGLHVTLIESVGKKAAFLEAAAASLGLPSVQVLRARAEEVGRDPEHRERYRTVTTRALARPAVALELTLPLVALGGEAQYWLGADDAEEFPGLAAIGLLGGAFDSLVEGHSPYPAEGWVARVRKERPTPPEYPRRVGVPAKRPLR